MPEARAGGRPKRTLTREPWGKSRFYLATGARKRRRPSPPPCRKPMPPPKSVWAAGSNGQSAAASKAAPMGGEWDGGASTIPTQQAVNSQKDLFFWRPPPLAGNCLVGQHIIKAKLVDSASICAKDQFTHFKPFLARKFMQIL